MIDKKFYVIAIILTLATVLTFAYSTFSQPPRERKDGAGWFPQVDANNNGSIEPEEYKTFTAEIFKNLDRNNDGVFDETERPRDRMPRDGRRRDQFPPDQNGDRQLQRPENEPRLPFFVMEVIKEPRDLTRAEFDEAVMQQFKLMDKNGDGVVSLDEARSRFAEVDERVKNERRPEDFRPLDSPTAQFIAAEMRFGDKLITGAPFSAKIVIEDTRRLYDGSTATKKTEGAVYRDREGRTRREQPIDNIGGFSVLSEDGSPQKLVFINDFPGKTHYFLDLNRKVARKNPLPDNRPPLAEKEPKDAKIESLGTKTMEGLTVEGTRTTFEIPVGQIGNDKPVQVVTEKWFSSELQVIIYSRHVDPIAGEHIFRLVNIKKTEPSADLFTVPNGFRIENPPRPDKRND